MAEKHFREMPKMSLFSVSPTIGISQRKMQNSPAVAAVLESITVSWTAELPGRHGQIGRVYIYFFKERKKLTAQRKEALLKPKANRAHFPRGRQLEKVPFYSIRWSRCRINHCVWEWGMKTWKTNAPCTNGCYQCIHDSQTRICLVLWTKDSYM